MGSPLGDPGASGFQAGAPQGPSPWCLGMWQWLPSQAAFFVSLQAQLCAHRCSAGLLGVENCPVPWGCWAWVGAGRRGWSWGAQGFRLAASCCLSEWSVGRFCPLSPVESGDTVPWKVVDGAAAPGGVLGTRWAETAARAGEAGRALSLDALELHVTAAVPARRRGAVGSRGGGNPSAPSAVSAPAGRLAASQGCAGTRPLLLPQPGTCGWEQGQGSWGCWRGPGGADKVPVVLLVLGWILAALHHLGRADAVSADRVRTPELIGDAAITRPRRCERATGAVRRGPRWPHHHHHPLAARAGPRWQG